MEQGVKIIDCTQSYKVTKDYEEQHEQLINSAINRLNREGKRVVNISISNSGNNVPLRVALLWEKHINKKISTPIKRDEVVKDSNSFDDLPEL